MDIAKEIVFEKLKPHFKTRGELSPETVSDVLSLLFGNEYCASLVFLSQGFKNVGYKNYHIPILKKYDVFLMFKKKASEIMGNISDESLDFYLKEILVILSNNEAIFSFYEDFEYGSICEITIWSLRDACLYEGVDCNFGDVAGKYSDCSCEVSLKFVTASTELITTFRKMCGDSFGNVSLSNILYRLVYECGFDYEEEIKRGDFGPLIENQRSGN